MPHPLLYDFISCKAVCIRPCSCLVIKTFRIFYYLNGMNIIKKATKNSFDTT